MYRDPMSSFPFPVWQESISEGHRKYKKSEVERLFTDSESMKMRNRYQTTRIRDKRWKNCVLAWAGSGFPPLAACCPAWAGAPLAGGMRVVSIFRKFKHRSVF
jgi:hypothetical protein